jgi:hypothetical protein
MRSQHSAVTIGIALSLLAAARPAVADVIDQDQPSGPAFVATFGQVDLAQSFQQSGDNVSGAGVLLQEGVGTTDTVTIQLWDALPNAGGTLLAEASATGTAGAWVDVFWGRRAVTPGATYYLIFGGNTTLGIAGDLADPYPGGQVFANLGYVAFPDFDFAFRTYQTTSVPSESHTLTRVKGLFR